MRTSHRSGLTLLELMVAISIIAVLMALLLPAVMSAREAARRAQCKNHVKQLATAMLNHQSGHRRFPSNGWGFLWVGHPERGSGKRQPGGWIYQILPSLDKQAYRRVGRRVSGVQRKAELAKLTQKPLPVLNCPARPDGHAGPANPAVQPRNANWAEQVAKTDYAVNEGDYITDTRGGPRSLEEGDAGNYVWRDTSKATGICFQRSEIRPQNIRDGLSQTCMLGEKYVSTSGYHSAEDPGHDQSLYSGVDVDINRWTIAPPRRDGAAMGLGSARLFGSAHGDGCHFAFCDGSVKFINYSIDADIHRRLGNRNDGQAVGDAQY